MMRAANVLFLAASAAACDMAAVNTQTQNVMTTCCADENCDGGVPTACSETVSGLTFPVCAGLVPIPPGPTGVGLSPCSFTRG